MSFYAGLGVYSREALDELLKASGLKGVVLGDLFCQRRMFEAGEWEIPGFAEDIKRSGKDVVLQTPMYLTPEKFTHWLRLIGRLDKSRCLDGVLLQDIGLLNALSQEYPGLNLCWSRMGKGRGGSINAQFVDFLRKLGIKAMELDRKARGEVVAEMGLKVWQVQGNLVYNSLWRECYTCYQLGIAPGKCDRECEIPLELSSDGFRMTVNGHLLGEKLEYKSETESLWPETERKIVYAKTITGLKETLRL